MLKKLRRGDAPHIRSSETSTMIMLDAIIALLPLYVMSYIYYGPRALLLGAVGFVSALLTGYLCNLLTDRRINLSDLSAAVTGLILPLIMPASVPYYVVIAAAVFAIMVVKFPFGGTGYNLFNPAAAGFAFASVCWSAAITSYPLPMQQLPLDITIPEGAISYSSSLSQTLASGFVPDIDRLDLFMGNFAGAMGATNVLVLLACGLYLILRRKIHWTMPLTFFATVTVFILAFPRTDASFARNIMYELCGSSVVFGGIFMLSDPVTMPKRTPSKMFYAFFAAILTMLFQYYGAFDQGVPFAIIIINVFAPLLDRVSEMILQKIRRKRIENQDRARA